MTRMTVTQVTFTEEGAFAGGEPLDDSTKVLVAALGDPIEAISLALAVAAGIKPEVDPPDDAIVSVVEKPKDAL